MFQLTVSYATHEELLAAVLALGGEPVAATPLGATLDRIEANIGLAPTKGKPGRKSAAEKKEATAAATTAGFAEVKAPATPAATVPGKTVADLKAAIGVASKGDIVKITEFVASLGVEKISDLAAAQIQEIFDQDKINAFFNKVVDIDPMS